MKQSMILPLMFILSACDGAIVISADGKMQKHYCFVDGTLNDPQAICLMKDCPDGYHKLTNEMVNGLTVPISHEPIYQCNPSRDAGAQ